jgi:HlyD family secretion protein
MRRGAIILLLVIVGVALVGGWWWARRSPDQVTEILVDGGLEAGRAEAFVALIAGQTSTSEALDALIASGSVEGESANLVPELGGRIVGLYADEGDQVKAGQVLAKLDDSLLQAEMAQAKAAVSTAEANLASVQAGTHPAEILAARAMLRQAIAERNAARTAWEDLQSILGRPQEIEAQLVEAQTAVDVATSQIKQAEAELAAAMVERDQHRAQGSLEEKKLYAIHSYNFEAASAALDAARANKAGAQETLLALQALRGNPLALASQVHSAEAQFKIAAAGVGVAAARLDELVAGPMPEEVEVAEAQVARAEAALGILQAQIDKMTLVSPIDGVVTSRSAHPGEAVVAGSTLLTVAELDEVSLTIYVPEDKLNRVLLGQTVEVQVDSFARRVFTGTVSHISQRAEFTPRNVQTQEERVNMVFAVKVRLPNPQRLLKPGMPADAVIHD